MAPAEVQLDPVARLLADREAQGFPSKITDPVVIDRIAAIVRGAKR